ncbi:hypothetical protein LOD99_4495 [Oopsacas minuta]|uniref:Uncharacterized protein n=1 Tax=Oopsacas minuta TaxID=111878 RepID=A0AAV7JUY4_9METZ|nr:hypothetical protein LOD99_4495 [Oopsacas minuta]
MATPLGNSERFWFETEILINESFNRIVDEVNERRILVLSQLKHLQNLKSEILKSINELENVKLEIKNEITQNRNHDAIDKPIADLNKKISLLQIDACNADVDYQFSFDDKELKRALAILGAIEKTPKHYLTKKHAHSVIPIASKKYSGRLSVNEELGLIAVNNFCENQIIYFSLEGKRLRSLRDS